MKPIPKWLMVPPAVALLLLLGPLSMQSSSAAATRGETAQAEPQQPASRSGSLLPTPGLPKTPGFWEIGSALLGVLLLGGIGVYGLRRLRGGATPTRGTTFLTLRQTMRLSPRQALHAVEFDDRILLVGESERGLTLLESGKVQAVSDDEAEVAARVAELLSSTPLEDEGAVPKNMVIPRPANGPQAGRPRQPALPRGAEPNKALGDFRALLQKAGRA